MQNGAAGSREIIHFGYSPMNACILLTASNRVTAGVLMSAQSVPPTPDSGLIIRESEPVNHEYSFDRLSETVGPGKRLTPNHLFYIRSHFKAPHIDAETHTLRIEGSVEAAFTLSVEDLRKLPSITCTVTLECAGNGRVFLSPAEEGAQWQLGAVGTAQWTGVPLTTLLDRAHLDPHAVELVFEGADAGKAKNPPTPPGEITYARSLPIAKAKDALIAYSMNGEDIPTDHGFPIRAIVPGYYGMSSVKWLTRIRAVDDPFQGYWQTSEYAYWEEQGGLPVRRPLGEVHLKSSIARPCIREVIPAGHPYTVFGAAWTGGPGVTCVEVTTDNGATWFPAELIDPNEYGVWRRWRFFWEVPSKPGDYILQSRATDEAGTTQREEHDQRFGSYVIDQTIPVAVTVR
jgi:DMSO/TMAO reductase YedYZ molybdopterin-dependent catalytic subunit